jgi:mRNA interferase RelE/StbE
VSTPYHIKVAPRAAKEIRELAPKNRKFIIKVAETLAINPRPPGAKKIEGMAGLYVEVIHHMRLIYKIEDQDVVLLLLK